MKFTYKAYSDMLLSLSDNGYTVCSYEDCDKYEKNVILRHDIDYSVKKALSLAQVEYEMGVKSTYFVLLTSPLYNLAGKDVLNSIKSIKKMGHDIGLHFDETNYDVPDGSEEYMKDCILKEISLMQEIIEEKVNVVSMHRPSKQCIEADYDLSPIINSYSSQFFKGYKYLSDSRRHWRENVDEIILSGEYKKLHILTHAFWYDREESSLEKTVSDYIMSGNSDRYEIMQDNISKLESIMDKPE